MIGWLCGVSGCWVSIIIIFVKLSGSFVGSLLWVVVVWRWVVVLVICWFSLMWSE